MAPSMHEEARRKMWEKVMRTMIDDVWLWLSGGGGGFAALIRIRRGPYKVSNVNRQGEHTHCFFLFLHPFD